MVNSYSLPALVDLLTPEQTDQHSPYDTTMAIVQLRRAVGARPGIACRSIPSKTGKIFGACRKPYSDGAISARTELPLLGWNVFVMAVTWG
jgi:hypothetical protein